MAWRREATRATTAATTNPSVARDAASPSGSTAPVDGEADGVGEGEEDAQGEGAAAPADGDGEADAVGRIG